MSKEQNIKLAQEFVQTQFVERGMVADLCIHYGKAKDGSEQPHAHVMLAMREVTAEGFGSNQPVADNTTAEGRRKNRRIEFNVQ